MVTINTTSLDYQRVISKANIGRGGTTLLYHPSLKIINSGMLSLGRAAWAQFQLNTTTLSIAIVYAPSDSVRARAYLWHQLKGKLPDGQWVILGDFNMTENPINSSGPSLLLNVWQKESWRLLKTWLDLVDAFSLPCEFIGIHFTKRAVHETRMDQS